MKAHEDKKRMEKALYAAEEAFWAEIVKHYPEVETGDFAPEYQFAWENAIEDALTAWLFWNHPTGGFDDE